MKVRILSLFAGVCMALGTAVSHAQTPYTAGPYACGPASEPLQCVGFPVLQNGVAVGSGWLHVYLVNSGPEYIEWLGNWSQVPQAVIDTSTCKQTQVFTSGTLHATECVWLDVSYHAAVDPSNVNYYTGSGTFYFTYVYSRGGGGRGGGGAGWKRAMTSGNFTIVNY